MTLTKSELKMVHFVEALSKMPKERQSRIAKMWGNRAMKLLNVYLNKSKPKEYRERARVLSEKMLRHTRGMLFFITGDEKLYECH